MSLGVRCATLCGRIGSAASLHHSAALRATDLSHIAKGEGVGGVTIPSKRRTGLEASFKKGTGGRASFSGNVITVFGATGYLGRAVINRLAKDGNQIIIPYRCDPYDIRQLKIVGELGQILFFPWNIADENSIRKVIKYSNIVVNLTGSTKETWNYDLSDVNEHGARRIAKVARAMGIRRLIHVSALNANENPEPHLIPGGSQVLRSKARGERAVREEFPDATIIRPAEIYGFNDRFIHTYGRLFRRNLRCILNKYTILYPMYKRGDETFKMPIYISDVAVGLQRLVNDQTTDGQTYEFVGPHCYKLRELIVYMCERAGMIPRYRHHVFPTPGINIAFGLKTNFQELRTFIWRTTQQWDWDYVERVEATSDVLTGCPTLQDLGIRDLHVIEWTCRGIIRQLSPIAGGFKMSDVENYFEPVHPPHYTPLRLGYDKAPEPIDEPKPSYSPFPTQPVADDLY